MRKRLRKKLVRKILEARTVVKPYKIGGMIGLSCERFNWPLYFDAIDQRGKTAEQAIAIVPRKIRAKIERGETIIKRFYGGSLGVPYDSGVDA